MNERIKQLALQSQLVYETTDGKVYNSWEDYVDLTEYVEKFAEKIVNECIDKITTYDLVPGHSAKWEDIYYTHARLLQDLGEELKEHFGVKE